MGVHVESNGGMLGGDLIVIGGSVRWTRNLFDRADVAVRGEAAVAHGKTDRTF